MSGMKQLNQRGHINGLLIPLIVVSLLFAITAGFAGWAYTSRQDYKDNSDAKSAAAVAVAEQKTSSKKDAEFIEKEKQPFHTYKGPVPFSSLVVTYPKTWSAYVSEKATGATPIDAYFHPTFVPAADNKNSYALRVQMVDTAYAAVLKSFEGNIKNGKIKASAYSPAKVPGVTGSRLDGEVVPTKQGAMIIVPVRDKTLKIWTESSDFLKDFNENILPNYTFSQ